MWKQKWNNTLRWRLMPKRSEAKNFWNLKNKHTFYFNNHSQTFSLCPKFSLCHRKIFSLCLKIFPCVKAKFPVFSLSGKSKNQIPCFPCAVATLNYKSQTDDINIWIICTYIYRPQCFYTCLSVILFTGAGCIPACIGTDTPLDRHTPRAHTPTAVKLI